MSDSDWSDIFVSCFVIIALAGITISAWIQVTKAVSLKLFGESDPNNPSLLPYVAAAIFITLVSLITIFCVHKFTTINLEKSDAVYDASNFLS